MGSKRSAATTLLLLAVLLASQGCLARRRLIASGRKPGTPRSLLTATKSQLIDRMKILFGAVHSFNATTDMTPALGSVYKGAITEYQDIRAYVLYRAPSDMRLIGLVPVLRNKAFDMVSKGNRFEISIPSKNKFVEGQNDAPPVSKNSIENLRPEAFLEAMLIPPPDLTKESALFIDSTDEEQALYILVLVGRNSSGDLAINRTIFFDRETLMIVRQKKYDRGGTILSDTRYKDWGNFNGVPFPKTIDINRPEDGYGVVMNIVKIDMNARLTDEQFVLQQPAGSQLQVIGESAANAPKEPAPKEISQ